jgi:hypothetical protein
LPWSILRKLPFAVNKTALLASWDQKIRET